MLCTRQYHLLIATGHTAITLPLLSWRNRISGLRGKRFKLIRQVGGPGPNEQGKERGQPSVAMSLQRENFRLQLTRDALILHLQNRPQVTQVRLWLAPQTVSDFLQDFQDSHHASIHFFSFSLSNSTY